MLYAGIAATAFVALIVGLAFGLALGLRWAEPRYKNPALHEGCWEREDGHGGIIVWRRLEPRRKNCHDDHRAFVCTIDSTTAHVDACDCGKTRQGVYGQWS